MRQQWALWLTAVMFYTRIRVPAGTTHRADTLNRATRYLPLVGWLVALIMIAVLALTGWIAPPAVAILLSMTAGIWTTGAFHEDGFADMCDGFGGGWTKERILDIMKDSRVGTFGLLGLVLLLALKFSALLSLPLFNTGLAIIVAQPLSRFTAVTIIYTHHYVRENEDSKAKPVSKGITGGELTFAAITGLLPLAGAIWYTADARLLVILPALFLSRWYMARLMQRWIGGYTGDCLGAVQQVAETVIYLCFCILEWKYT